MWNPEESPNYTKTWKSSNNYIKLTRDWLSHIGMDFTNGSGVENYDYEDYDDEEEEEY